MGDSSLLGVALPVNAGAGATVEALLGYERHFCLYPIEGLCYPAAFSAPDVTRLSAISHRRSARNSGRKPKTEG